MNDSIAIAIPALGGALAALVLRSLFRLIGKLWSGSHPVAEYSCADQSKVELSVLVGLLRHGKGYSVDDTRTRRRRVWEHSTQDAETNRIHTVYGPYVNDFGRPGFYRVSFRIYGSGFSDDGEPVLVLDILQRPAFLRDDALAILGQRVVRAQELKPEYVDFDVYCYAAGSGTHEYRCLVIPEAFKSEQHTLRFDTIRVYRYVPAWEVL